MSRSRMKGLALLAAGLLVVQAGCKTETVAPTPAAAPKAVNTADTTPLNTKAEMTSYAIGVDTDQASLFGNEPKKADQILTSTEKRVDLTLFQAVSRFMNGENLGGQQVYIGAAEGAIAYAPFSKAVPATLVKELEKLQADIKAGGVKIPSAFSMTADQINAMRDAVNAAKK